MAYVSDAMYRSITPGRRLGQSPDAAVIGAAYTVLSHYFPAQQANLDSLRDEALGALPNDQTKIVGMRYGRERRPRRDRRTERRRAGDTDRLDVDVPDAHTGTGRVAADAGCVGGTADAVGRPGAAVHPELGESVPAAATPVAVEHAWVTAFNEIKQDGSSTNPNTTETGIAKFWTANVIRQYNELARDVASAQGSDLVRPPGSWRWSTWSAPTRRSRS